MKKILIFITMLIVVIPTIVFAEDDIDEIIENMTTEEKIAQMIMPDFRWSDEANTKMKVITPEVEDLLKEYNFAGVILFSQNIEDVEQTTILIDALQKASAENPDAVGQLLIAVDQEGGYITRLAQGTVMPGNMGIAATGDPALAYESAATIGEELDAMGFNTDFAPVIDVNSNPANPVIGVRSFSDDPDIVAEYGVEFMNGLHDNDIATVVKHFPGHGDTSSDTHTDMTVVDKSKEELVENELKPFQALIDAGTDMVMTAHIQYPQIEDETYVSQETGEEITLPATLSKKIINDVLREEMGYDGIIITDALDMGAVAKHFDPLDSATLAINAGVDILLMPVDTKGIDGLNNLRDYITSVSNLVDNNTISSDNVNASVKRILTLKKNKGLLEEYDVIVEDKVMHALKIVSTPNNHEKEIQITKNAITLVKSDGKALPIDPEEKTMFVYGYGSHKNSAQFVIDVLTRQEVITDEDNFSYYNFDTELDDIKAEIPNVQNVVIIHAMYDLTEESAFDSQSSFNVDEIINTSKENGVKTIFISTMLPYDIGRFNDADAIMATYLANGLSYDLLNYDTSKPIPKYGPNLMAGIYSLFEDVCDFPGVLPVNIYEVDDNYQFTDNILYARGTHFDISSLEEEIEEEADDITNNPKTNDNILVYIATLLLSVSGLLIIKKYN